MQKKSIDWEAPDHTCNNFQTISSGWAQSSYCGRMKLLLIVRRMNGKNVSFQVTLVTWNVIAQMAGETLALMNSLDVDSEINELGALLFITYMIGT